MCVCVCVLRLIIHSNSLDIPLEILHFLSLKQTLIAQENNTHTHTLTFNYNNVSRERFRLIRTDVLKSYCIRSTHVIFVGNM